MTSRREHDVGLKGVHLGIKLNDCVFGIERAMMDADLCCCGIPQWTESRVLGRAGGWK